MTDRWIDDLLAEPVDTDPRPGFRDDLRLALEAEWHSPATAAAPVPNRRRRWALAGAAASVAALVVALATVSRNEEREPVDTSGVATQPPATPSPVVTTTPATSAPPPVSTTEPPSPPTTTAATATPMSTLPPDHVCLGDILAPPQLVGGGEPGEYTIDSSGGDGVPMSVRWGGDGADAVIQALRWDPASGSPSTWFDEAAGSDQIRTSSRYEAAVIPVGDPPLGRIQIYVREIGTQCVRVYLIEEGFTLGQAIAYGQTFVDELSQAAASVPDVPTTVVGQGTEIGFGSVGAAISVPQPWPIGTIYSDLEPGLLVVDFNPPDPNCIAAQANARIGRGGAILVSLWIEGEPRSTGCTGSSETNQIRIPLAEPLGNRRIYTSTVPATQGASEEAELLADRIIGVDEDEAIALIERKGFEVRDVTGADAVESDFRPDRINIERARGVIEFATVG